MRERGSINTQHCRWRSSGDTSIWASDTASYHSILIAAVYYSDTSIVALLSHSHSPKIYTQTAPLSFTMLQMSERNQNILPTVSELSQNATREEDVS